MRNLSSSCNHITPENGDWKKPTKLRFFFNINTIFQDRKSNYPTAPVMDLLYSTFKWEGWIMMRRESFPALIKQPGCIKVSLHMARGWNGIVFNVSSNSNHPMVPWSSPVHSSCNTERISRGFDAHQKGIFHHQVWSDFSHCRRFLTLCEFHVCRVLKTQQIWLRLYTVLRRYNPNLQ